jgi:hypothetical protein
VRLIGQFRKEQEIVATEAVRVVKLLLFIHVGAGERHVEERALISAVFPDGRFVATEAKRFDGR